MRRIAPLLPMMMMLLACRHETTSPSFERPPIILISIDTLRADHLPAYGYANVRTPHIDTLRRDGMLYENAYSPCPMTLPSHVSMLTGLQPTEHEVRNNLGYRFDAAKHPTIAQTLKQQGYATGAAVSSYVLRAETGLGAAFDFYDDAIPVATTGAVSQHQRPGFATLEVARRWIGEHAQQPFFFFFHIYEPHAPYEPSYDGEVVKSDALVGELIAFLKQSGIYDRAIVVLTSDHGEGLWEHGEDQHGILLYREVLHVPLIIKLPAPHGGTSVKEPVALTDLAPTLLHLLDLESKGVNIAAGPIQPRRIYSETFYPRIHLGWSELRSLIDERHHYIDAPRAELYDVVADAKETKDLAATERRIAASMRKELESYPSGVSELQAIDPEDAKKLEALGYLGSVRATTGSERLPNPRDMLKYLERIKAGFKLADERKYGEATAVLRALVKENPGLFDVWDKLGEVLSETGQYEEAIRVYREAMSRTQRFSPEMALSLGDVYLKADQPEEAGRYAQLALKSLPSQAHALLTRIAIAQRRFDVAGREAQLATGSQNPQPSALLLLAEVKRAEGDLPGALAAIETTEARARALHVAKLYRLDFLRGDVLARMGRVDEAVAAYRREIENFPQHTQAYANLAIIYFIEGKRAEVDRLLARMVEVNPHPGARELAARTRESLR